MMRYFECFKCSKLTYEEEVVEITTYTKKTKMCKELVMSELLPAEYTTIHYCIQCWSSK